MQAARPVAGCQLTQQNLVDAPCTSSTRTTPACITGPHLSRHLHRRRPLTLRHASKLESVSTYGGTDEGHAPILGGRLNSIAVFREAKPDGGTSFRYRSHHRVPFSLSIC
ncbi:hypothetical protein J2S89_004119 [Arthrobacter bambusae]|nr:hypothetical protein [Arthrobacter bambusae]MDQ0100378.1 hypothetical protein [Arthrobacter bambusae]